MGFRLAVIALFALVTVGCASYKPLHVNVRSIENYKNQVNHLGLKIAVDPFDTPQKAESAFYMDLTSREIKPLHIIIANNSSETFMISRSGIYTSSYTKADLHPVNSNYVFSKFEYSKLKRAFFGFDNVLIFRK